MKFTELSKSLNKLANVYLISGEDRFLCYSALQLITKATKIVNTDLNYNMLENASVDEIVSCASSYPFMDNYRMVVVKDFNSKNITTKQKDKFVEYIKNPLDTTVLVIINFADDSFFKSLKDNITVVDCNKLDARAVSDYIEKRFKEANVPYMPTAINLIGQYCLLNMQKISSEVDKLIAYSGSKLEITDEVVNSLVVKDKEYQVYQLADFLSTGKGVQAYDLLDAFAKKNGQSLLPLLYNNYRRALYVSINTNLSDGELSKLLNIKEYAVKMTKNQMRAFSPKKLKQIVDMLKNLDADIKKGKFKEDVAVKLAISNILNLRNK